MWKNEKALRRSPTDLPGRTGRSVGKIGAVGQNDGVVLRCQTGHLIIYSEPSRECFRLSVGKRNEVGKTVSEVANPVSRIEITSRLTRKTVSRPLKRHRAWGKQGLLFIRQGGTRERLAEKPAAFRPPFRSFALSFHKTRRHSGASCRKTCGFSPAVPLVCTIFAAE